MSVPPPGRAVDHPGTEAGQDQQELLPTGEGHAWLVRPTGR